MPNNDSKPDETAVSPAMRAPESQDTDVKVIQTDAGTATGSHKPKPPPPKSEDEANEYILEREPDGRYRIMERRPRRQG